MFRAPGHAGLPGIDLLLADLPCSLAHAARHLGLKESTLKAYKRAGSAPRTVLLSLFWETRWGRSAADTEAANAASTHYRLAKSFQSEIERLHLVIDRLERELSQRQGVAANAPIYRVR